MKRILALAAVLLAAAAPAGAASLRSYQVTGPVIEVRDDAVVVERGSEKWEIARDKETRVAGDLKAGATVTILYQMKASSVEVRSEGKK